MRAFRGSLAVLLVLLAQQGSSAPIAEEKKYFQLNDVVPLDYKFLARGFNGSWISGTEFLISKPEGRHLYDATTQKSTLFIPKQVFEYLNTSEVMVSPDRKYLLARSDPLIGFRYSSLARFALYNMETNETYKIANHSRLHYCTFSGKNHSVGFVLDNDVYYLNDVKSKEIRLTFDGVNGIIYNGVPDWVYEEEVFSSSSAMWFSKDGMRLAIASFDDREVDIAFYMHYGDPSTVDDQYTTIEMLRYPKVGRRNPDVKLRVTNLSANSSFWIQLKPPKVGVNDSDTILGAVMWVSDNEVAALWLNRRQNNSILVICNADTGECKDELKRSEPNGWIEVSKPQFYENEFIDIAFVPQGPGETNAWSHVVKYTRGNPIPVALSNGTRTVTRILGWNKKLNKVYYLSTLENKPWQQHLWVGGNVSKCISCDIKLPDGNDCRFATATMGESAEVYSFTCQGGGPAYTALYNGNTDNFTTPWEDNENVRKELEGYYMPNEMFLRVPVAGGFQAAVKMYLPPDLNPNKTYPMVVNIYTGPNSARVLETFNLGYHSYMSTNRSIIYCLMEGRGSGLKGKDMLFSINNRLGTDEIVDVINVTKILTEKYSWIDKNNVGLWGWSYGGFATAMALTRDVDHVFSCGISVAPVTSWLYYDTIYTERFMGTPQENPIGYHEGDVNNRAKYLEGRHFLLIHGNADDNVHYQNAMALARVLQLLDIPFEQMSYPDEAHGLSGVTAHLYHTIDDFWSRCFQNRTIY